MNWTIHSVGSNGVIDCWITNSGKGLTAREALVNLAERECHRRSPLVYVGPTYVVLPREDEYEYGELDASNFREKGAVLKLRDVVVKRPKFEAVRA